MYGQRAAVSAGGDDAVAACGEIEGEMAANAGRRTRDEDAVVMLHDERDT